MPDPVLVTGGAGFIGSGLVDRLLAEGRRVVAVDDLSHGTLSNLAEARANHPGAFEFHRLDVTSDALGAIISRHRPATVFHLAAPADPLASVEDPVRDATTNVMGTVRVLDAARRNGVRKVVLATSAALLDGGPARTPHDAGRRSAEAYVRAFAEAHELAFTCLGLAEVYGPRQGGSGVVGRLLADQQAMRPCTIHGDGRRTLDFVFVDDVVDALARSIGHGDGCAVAIGTGTATSVLTLHAALAAVTGTPHDPVHASPRAVDADLGAVDPSPAREALGWEPFTALDLGLATTLRRMAQG